MACRNCAKIRTALLHGKMAEAAGLSVEALREKIGFGVARVEPEPVPPKPLSLAGKNKAELLEIAVAEGVGVEEGATNAQIAEAIEKQRRVLADA